MKWHINPNGKGQLTICKAMKQCPFSDSEHFNTKEEGQVYLDNYFEKQINYNTEVTLSKHNSNEGILITKNVEIIYEKTKKKINYLEKKMFPKWYQSYVKSCQKLKVNTLSKEKALELFDKSINGELSFNKEKIEIMTQEVGTFIQQRKQAVHFYHKFKKSIVDKSFSHASGSSYFVCKKDNLENMMTFLKQQGLSFESRQLLQSTKGETFLVRFADHYPKNYYKRKKHLGDKVDLWKCTDASLLVTYKETQCPKHSIIKMIDDFYNDRRNLI